MDPRTEDTDKDGASALTLEAVDISCAGCAEDMASLLKRKKGVLDASVDFSSGRIMVLYDPGVIDKKGVFLAVRRLGFRVRPA